MQYEFWNISAGSEKDVKSLAQCWFGNGCGDGADCHVS